MLHCVQHDKLPGIKFLTIKKAFPEKSRKAFLNIKYLTVMNGYG